MQAASRSRSRDLQIGDGIALPVDAVTWAMLFLGKRGSGKTNGAAVVAEECARIGAPFVVLDPINVWFGLKAAANGRDPGLEVIVFGGPHADVPLEPTAGAFMAQLIVEHRFSCVLSMKGWSGKQRAQFVADFAETLLDKNTDPLHVIVEEADAFIPQKPYPGEERMLGAMDRLVRWGRSSGLGASIVSQRSAKINKDVTTQADGLASFKITGPQDRDTADSWIKYHQAGDERTEMLATLPRLSPGESWLWVPELDVFRRVQWRRRWTFDSAATPKLGAARVTPKLAAVDLEAVRGQMAEMIERAKADDPRELRRRLADAERRVRELEARPAPEPETRVERVEVPVLDEQLVVRLEQALAPAAAVLGDVQDRLGWQVKQQGEAIAFERRLATPPPPASRTARDDLQVRAVAVRATPAPARPRPAAAVGRGGDLPEGERKILVALCQMGPLPRESLTIVTGYKRSTRDAYIQRLSTKGMVTVSADRRVAATEAGEDALGDFERLPTGAALRDWWLERLPDGESRILAVLMDAYPNPVARAELDDLGFKRSTRDAYLQRLTARQLVAGARGEVAAADVLFA